MRFIALFKPLRALLTLIVLNFPTGLEAKAVDGITLTLNNAPLQKVFTAIEAQSVYHFVFTTEQLINTKPVTISVTNMPIQDVLNLCFLNQPLHYSLEDKYIIVRKKENEVSLPGTENTIISGVVNNEKGDPLVGITVTVQGTAIATSTSADGSFVLKRVPDGATIVFSGANVESKQIVLQHKQETVSVVLKAKVSKLDDVQIIAYGTTTRRLSTGDVSTISSETIAEQPVFNTLSALEGRAPGLVITQVSGINGSDFFVQIRGRNSMGSGNNPLYIVDGIPYPSIAPAYSGTSSGTISGGSPLSNLNPSDIESVSVLKDADATSIYGSRGANGVILITTKKGKEGNTKADASIYFGAGRVTREMHLLNTPDYLEMRHEAFTNDGQSPDVGSAPDLLLWDTTRYTNWQKQLIGGTSDIFDAQASLSGGNAYTQFLFGLGYHQESTVFPGDFGNHRLSGHLSINHMSRNQKLKLSVLVNYSSFINNLMGFDPTLFSLFTAPDAPEAFDSTGKLNWADGTFNNPYGRLQQKYNSNTGNVFSHADISYQLNAHFLLQVTGGFSNIQVDEILATPKTVFNPRFGVGSSSVFANSSLHTWIVEPQIQYKTSMPAGTIQILAGATFQQDINSSQSLRGAGYSSDALLEDLQAASSVTVNSYDNSNYKYEAIFGRINYNYQDRYLINITGRRDGSSRFGPGNQFANFGALGAAWIFSKTRWLQENAPVISFAKLRGSYGVTGNDQIGNYEYLDTYSSTPYAYMGTSGLISTRLYNPNYSWETNYKLEGGLQLSFWKDRLGTSISWYRNRCSNQLVGYPVPLITGQTSVQQNLSATVQNTGWEIDVNASLIKSAAFQWNASINLTIPSNKLISFPDLEASAYANTYEVGKSLYILKAFHYTGVDPQTGVYTFEDVNHDGQISYPEDLTTYKQISQRYYGGFQNVLDYKGIRLEIFFQFVSQTGFNYLNSTFSAPGMISNQPDWVMNRWQQPGDIKNIQQFTQDYGSSASMAYDNTQNLGDNRVGDASYIRLKNISLSYSFNKNFLQKIHADACTLFIQGQNLLTITSFQGLDPENQNTTALPPLKILSAGLRCSF